MNATPPNKARRKFDRTFSNNTFPSTEATVGRSRAPHRILVADTGSDKGGNS